MIERSRDVAIDVDDDFLRHDERDLVLLSLLSLFVFGHPPQKPRFGKRRLYHGTRIGAFGDGPSVLGGINRLHEQPGIASKSDSTRSNGLRIRHGEPLFRCRLAPGARGRRSAGRIAPMKTASCRNSSST